VRGALAVLNSASATCCVGNARHRRTVQKFQMESYHITWAIWIIALAILAVLIAAGFYSLVR
jgi:hypothetical protein